MTARILIAEDDVRIAAVVKRGLVAEGYDVECVQDGAAALTAGLTDRYHVVILDRRLPIRDGLEVCRGLRAAGSRTRILMLTAMDRLQDKIDGLRGGADDYLTKPFAFAELLARIDALLRRDESEPEPTILECADVRIDLLGKTVQRGSRSLALTAREFALLVHLVKHAGQVVTRKELRQHVWGRRFDTGTKIVDVYVRYLRSKLEVSPEPALIHTVRGFGYLFSERPPR
jgi:two-component system OmpR family response regulator